MTIVSGQNENYGLGRRLLPDASAISHLWTGASLSKPKPLVYLCAFAVVAGLILGGGTRGGFLSDAILQLLAIPLLLVSIWKIVELPLTKQARLALWFCVAIALVPLLQLVPLPPSIWTALPNRQPSVEAFELLGKPVPWMPISVSPEATWLSALSLIPPIAIFLATLLLSYRERRLLTLSHHCRGHSQRLSWIAPSRARRNECFTVLRNHQSAGSCGFLRQQESLRGAALLPDPVCRRLDVGQDGWERIEREKQASTVIIFSTVII